MFDKCSFSAFVQWAFCGKLPLEVQSTMLRHAWASLCFGALGSCLAFWHSEALSLSFLLVYSLASEKAHQHLETQELEDSTILLSVFHAQEVTLTARLFGSARCGCPVSSATMGKGAFVVEEEIVDGEIHVSKPMKFKVSAPGLRLLELQSVQGLFLSVFACL